MGVTKGKKLYRSLKSILSKQDENTHTHQQLIQHLKQIMQEYEAPCPNGPWRISKNPEFIQDVKTMHPLDVAAKYKITRSAVSYYLDKMGLPSLRELNKQIIFKAREVK